MNQKDVSTVRLIRAEARRHRALAALLQEPHLVQGHLAVAAALDRAVRKHLCQKSKSVRPSSLPRAGFRGRPSAGHRR